jgi:aspartate/methionine/tyrosine aminotransferase
LRRRDTVLYPAVAYPTYEMGARLAGLRAVPVPLDERWHLDLSRISEADADRALVIWVNEPGNPTGASGGRQHLRAVVDWARECGAIVASDECYAEFTYDESGSPAAPVTVLSAGHDRVLAVHSLSKRSNMAVCGRIPAGDALVSYLGGGPQARRAHDPAPVQAAAAAALGDDSHVDAQRERYRSRRAALLPRLEAWGLEHDGGPSTFYLWLRSAEGHEDGWSLTARLAATGTLVAPGELYGPEGSDHVRLALSITDEQVDRTARRLDQAIKLGGAPR